MNSLRSWLAAGLVACLALAPMSLNAAEGAKPLYTSKSKFRIPFQFDAAEMRRLNAVEIQLHVSTDRGATWSQDQAVDPAAGKFAFEAPAAGEYWFAVRTIDRNRRSFPEGPLEVGLKVVVDLAPPTLELRVEPLGRERVSLSWDATDPNLDTASLLIESRMLPDGEWQAVAILPAASGQTSWTTRGIVEVRGTIKDLAGNLVQATASSQPGSMLNAPTIPAARPLSQPLTRPFGSPRSSEPDFTKPVADAGAMMPPELPVTPPQTAMQMPVEQEPAGNLPVITSKNPTNYFRHQQRVGATLTNNKVSQRPAVTMDRWGPPLGQPVVSEPTAETPRPTSIRSVRNRSFWIGYQVDDVGPSGVSNVDLYISEDNGKKWFHYGSDPDRTSPFEVVVPKDGMYGFCIRVQNGAGVVSDPPQPGDVPEIQISVDQVAPVIQMLPIRQGQGMHNNQVLIEWIVKDDLLAENPIALSYADSAAGPWKPITAWTANTGRYVWTINEPLRQNVFIRLEAQDAAGNVAQAMTEQPLTVDLSRPTARIVDVEPAARTPQ